VVNGITIYLKVKAIKYTAEYLIIKVTSKMVKKMVMVIINGINYNIMMVNLKITNYLDLVNI
jgi:hypothetical protein